MAKKVITIVAVIELAAVGLLWHADIQGFLQVHTWIKDTLAALPVVTGMILGIIQWHDSGKIAGLSEQNYKLSAEANDLRKAANDERARANEYLAEMANNSKKSLTAAERNAALLVKHLREKVVAVNPDGGTWGEAPEIVEVKDEVVTLFTASNARSSGAFSVQVHCNDLEITETPSRPLPMTVRVLKRFGTDQTYGEVKTWEETRSLRPEPVFPKGENVLNAEYVTSGSPEKRSLNIFGSSDGSNHYLLETSEGGKLTGDNVGVSRHFLLAQLGYQKDGFRWNGGRTGGSKHPLFVNTHN